MNEETHDARPEMLKSFTFYCYRNDLDINRNLTNKNVFKLQIKKNFNRVLKRARA